jgi:hypothetical protein
LFFGEVNVEVDVTMCVLSSVTSDPGTIRLRHVVTGMYLTAMSERITMLSGDEMKRQKSVTHWSITSAD